MTDKDRQLLAEFESGILPRDAFLENFSVNVKNDVGLVRGCLN